MTRNAAIVILLVLALGLGYGFGQKAKPAVSVNSDIAWFRLDGSRLSQTAAKRLTFVSLHYNDASIPCILVDTLAGELSNNTVGGASISCGWTPEAIQTLGHAGQ